MQFRNPHTFGPLKSAFSTGFPRLSRENRTIEKREKWRPATRATGDETATQTSFQLFMCGRYALHEKKRKMKLTTTK